MSCVSSSPSFPVTEPAFVWPGARAIGEYRLGGCNKSMAAIGLDSTLYTTKVTVFVLLTDSGVFSNGNPTTNLHAPLALALTPSLSLKGSSLHRSYHNVLLRGLKERTVYEYRVRVRNMTSGGHLSEWSQWLSFRSLYSSGVTKVSLTSKLESLRLTTECRRSPCMPTWGSSRP